VATVAPLLVPAPEPTLPRIGVVSIVSVRVLQRADDGVLVTGALRGGQAVITGGLQCATEVMRVPTETDPVR